MILRSRLRTTCSTWTPLWQGPLGWARREPDDTHIEEYGVRNKVWPLNSRRMTAVLLGWIANTTALPTDVLGEQSLIEIATGKEPMNVQVLVPGTVEAPALQDIGECSWLLWTGVRRRHLFQKRISLTWEPSRAWVTAGIELARCYDDRTRTWKTSSLQRRHHTGGRDETAAL